MSDRREKYCTYNDDAYKIIFQIKHDGKGFEEAQQYFPNLKIKTFQSINNHEKKSPLKQFKREVTAIVFDQLSQMPKLQAWLQEQGLKNFSCQVRKLIRIAMGPNGVQRPIEKQNKELRRSKQEILENIFDIYGLTKPSKKKPSQRIKPYKFQLQQIRPQVNQSPSINQYINDQESQVHYSCPSNDYHLDFTS